MRNYTYARTLKANSFVKAYRIAQVLLAVDAPDFSDNFGMHNSITPKTSFMNLYPATDAYCCRQYIFRKYLEKVS